MSALVDQRVKFSILLSKLILWGNEQPGWQLALGRDFDEAHEKLHHMASSLHYLGLANDVALYIDGVYQDKTEAYERIGMIWKAMDKDCRWGGDFKKPDGNHVSVAFGGKA
jgi:hypothetical protein